MKAQRSSSNHSIHSSGSSSKLQAFSIDKPNVLSALGDMQQLVDDVFWKVELLKQTVSGYGIAPMIEYQPSARLSLAMPWEDFDELFINSGNAEDHALLHMHDLLIKRNSKFVLTSCTTYPDRNGFGIAEFQHYGKIDFDSIKDDALKLVDDLYACKIEDTLSGE